ncbi:hypothetical protein NL466_29195, partial [Klebsiella pneumoniae]|nr:hypothetical protein [Klebsiella pneumoniae]
RTEIVTMQQGGNPALLPQSRRTASLGLTIKPLPKAEWRLSLTYEATTNRNTNAVVASLNPLTEAIAPGLAQRDAGGRLVQVNYR